MNPLWLIIGSPTYIFENFVSLSLQYNCIPSFLTTLEGLNPMLTECNAIRGRFPKVVSSKKFYHFMPHQRFEQWKALCDLGVSINLTSLSILKKMGIGDIKPTIIWLQLTEVHKVSPSIWSCGGFDREARHFYISYKLCGAWHERCQHYIDLWEIILAVYMEHR